MANTNAKTPRFRPNVNEPLGDTAVATFWATLEKLGYFLPQHLVTLEATLSHFLFIAFSYKGSHFSTHITSICTTM